MTQYILTGLVSGSIYGASFFTLTGLHGFHVLIGVCFLVVVLNLDAHGAGDILNQRAAPENIEALNAVADRQDWLTFGEGVLQEREIDPLAVRIGFGTFRLPESSKMRWIDICGAS